MLRAHGQGAGLTAVALLQLLGTGLVTAVEDRLENPMARTGVGGFLWEFPVGH